MRNRRVFGMLQRNRSIGNAVFAGVLLLWAVSGASLGVGMAAGGDPGGTISGTVKNASGEPVEGALVRVRSEDRRLGFLVVSQARGRYATPPLPPGKYRVESFGGAWQSPPGGTVEVRGGEPAKVDPVLSAPRKASTPPQEVTFQQRLKNADYLKAMPEGNGKKLILTRCVFCHGVERIVPRRASREEWEKSLDDMIANLKDHRIPVTDQEKKTLLDYVVENFGPDKPAFARPEKGPAPDPDSNLPTALLQGPEAKFVSMEFYIEKGTWSHHLAVDSKGVAWFSETNAGMLGRFDGKTLEYSRIAPPPGRTPKRFINAVQVDRHDNVWFTDNDPNGLLIQYNPATKEFATYDIPVPPGLKPNMNTIRFDADGNVWGTGISSDQIMKLDLATKRWTQFPVVKGTHPYGMAIGGDKMIWYAAQYDNEAVRLDPATGKLTHYKVPTPRSDVRCMQADSEGNLWMAGHESGKLLKVDYRTGKITEYELPTKRSGLFSVDVDRKQDRIWFGETYAGKLGRFDPKSNTFSEFPLPGLSNGEWIAEFSDANVLWIQVDPTNPNRVWWSGGGMAARVGYVEALE